MARNIEIKAKLPNPDEAIQKAIKLSTSEGKTILQTDYYFKANNGRLKLRLIDGEGEKTNELIYYNRKNDKGPKLSDYNKINVDNAVELLDVLTKSITLRGIVKKVRNLYFVGQTRIHIDQVEKLGSFIELEVVLEENQSVNEGTSIAEELMKTLNIKDDELITHSYIDFIEELNYQS